MAADGRRSRFGVAGRLALFPARAAARATRRPLEAAADDHLVPELSRLADRAFASELPEELARSIAEHHVLERVALELAENGALDSAVEKVLASPQTKETVDRLVRSDEVRLAIKEVVASPEVRAALAEQSVGMAEEMAADVRSRTRVLDDRIGRSQVGNSGFAGVATRAVVLVVDGLAIAVVYALVAGVLGLVSYLVGGLRPTWLVETLVGSLWALVAGSYLVFFWSTTGRTPGMHVMQVRVRDRAGKPPGVMRSILRVVVTWLSIVPFFLGYVTVLFDKHRRGLPDLVARTEVFYDR
ncbi:MAG TPA: RDD family protein [Gaiellaceae bacterium]|jgi:uncharacterized RDD family membrane protein YckC|nr:RDD family protein [Gaiellaceae bacterium]